MDSLASTVVARGSPTVIHQQNLKLVDIFVGCSCNVQAYRFVYCHGLAFSVFVECVRHVSALVTEINNCTRTRILSYRSKDRWMSCAFTFRELGLLRIRWVVEELPDVPGDCSPDGWIALNTVGILQDMVFYYRAVYIEDTILIW